MTLVGVFGTLLVIKGENMNYYYGLVDKENLGYGFVEEGDFRITDNFIKITENEWQSLLEEQSNNKEIVFYDGKIFATEPNIYFIDSNGVWQKRNNEEINKIKKQQKIEETNYDSKSYLNNTDWLVTRHRDQLAMNLTTSLSEEEYQALLLERQKARESVIEVQYDITN